MVNSMLTDLSIPQRLSYAGSLRMMMVGACHENQLKKKRLNIIFLTFQLSDPHSSKTIKMVISSKLPIRHHRMTISLDSNVLAVRLADMAVSNA